MVKNHAGRANVASVTIPAIGSSVICPFSALRDILQVQTSPNDPLFQIQTKRGTIPLTDSVARKHLKQLSIGLNTPKIITFHDFRRAGATWAFRAGVQVQDIQAQGTWSSNCVWRYIQVQSSGFSFPVSLVLIMLVPLLLLGSLGFSLPPSDYCNATSYTSIVHCLNLLVYRT